MADVGAGLHIKLREQVEVTGGGIDFRGDLSIGQRVRHLIRFTELAFDLHKKGYHARLRAGARSRPLQSSKKPSARQGGLRCGKQRTTSIAVLTGCAAWLSMFVFTRWLIPNARAAMPFRHWLHSLRPAAQRSSNYAISMAGRARWSTRRGR